MDGQPFNPITPSPTPEWGSCPAPYFVFLTKVFRQQDRPIFFQGGGFGPSAPNARTPLTSYHIGVIVDMVRAVCHPVQLSDPSCAQSSAFTTSAQFIYTAAASVFVRRTAATGKAKLIYHHSLHSLLAIIYSLFASPVPPFCALLLLLRRRLRRFRSNGFRRHALMDSALNTITPAACYCTNSIGNFTRSHIHV